MEQTKHLGPKAGSLKYDLLTALSVTGLHGNPTEQTSLMRLIVLITARYNWRVEEVSIGHTEMARLWSVNERTVKREMKRLLEMGVILCVRPGVRGRVGAYRLNYQRIYELSRPSWTAVGLDYEERMMDISGERTVVKVDFQKPMLTTLITTPSSGTGTWGAVQRRLKAEYPSLFESWFGKLVQEKVGDHILTLRAPSEFVSRYIETHFAVQLAGAIDAEMPTPDGAPRKITLIT